MAVLPETSVRYCMKGWVFAERTYVNFLRVSDASATVHDARVTRA